MACPKCGSDNIDYGQFDSDGEYAWQEMTCSDCGYQMNDVYQYWRREDAITCEEV